MTGPHGASLLTTRSVGRFAAGTNPRRCDAGSNTPRQSVPTTVARIYRMLSNQPLAGGPATCARQCVHD